MEISLVRHGRSKWVDQAAVTSKEFEKWVIKYDEYGVFEEETYPLETKSKLETASVIYCSNLFRTRETVRLLTDRNDIITSSIFRETELPKTSIFLTIQFPPRIWAVLLRCLWFLGYSRGCESIKMAKLRAKHAAVQLIEQSAVSKSVVLVGHGFFNMLIAKELQRMGWNGAKRPKPKHLQITTYTFQTYS